MSSDERRPSWTFLTNHTQVLLCIAQNSSKVTLRDVAQLVGITERAVQRIVADLAAAGIIERRRVGRRNHYLINRSATMRHAAQAEHHVGPLLDLLRPKDERDTG
jgi:DNA-binding IscR family transcriptional regulator